MHYMRGIGKDLRDKNGWVKYSHLADLCREQELPGICSCLFTEGLAGYFVGHVHVCIVCWLVIQKTSHFNEWPLKSNLSRFSSTSRLLIKKMSVTQLTVVSLRPHEITKVLTVSVSLYSVWTERKELESYCRIIQKTFNPIIRVLTLSLSSTRSLRISSGSRIPPSQYSTWWVRTRKSPSYNTG